MPREPRLDTRFGLYHVIGKGNGGNPLFVEDSDYSKFTMLMDDSRKKDPHFLLSYCLMPNHIHLLIETGDVPLSRIMHRLLLRYSIFFNRKYKRSGHLFQNRFKAKPCRDENYLLRLLIYIHDNPRKAGLVFEGKTYPFSSERDYQRRWPMTAPVNSKRAMQLAGPSPQAAWEAYHFLLNDIRKRKSFTYQSEGSPLFTEPAFHPGEEMYSDVNVPSMEYPVKPQGEFEFLGQVPLPEICSLVGKVMGVAGNQIGGRSKEARISRARCAFIFITRQAGWRPVDLIDHFGFNPGSIAYHLSRFENLFSSAEKVQIFCGIRKLFDETTRPDADNTAHDFSIPYASI